MKAELQQRLYKEFPKIFKQKDLSCQETCMCWGIECPDTWFDILYCLCWHIQYEVENNNICQGQIEAVQVKEKYGTLRFYYDGGNDKIDKLVEWAEDMSASICADCGSNDNVKATGGWVTYLCKNCRDK